MKCRTQSSKIVQLGWTAFIAFHLVFPSNIVAVPVACCEHDHNGDGRITEEDFDPLRAGHSLIISNCLEEQCPRNRPESGPPSPGGGGIAAPPLVPAPSPPADDNHEPPTPPEDDPAAPDEPEEPQDPNEPELPDDIDGPNPPKKSPCPVYLASGEKIEAQIDARVKLPGQDLIIWREYTSRQTPGTVWELGEGWTLSIFNSIRVQAIEGGYEITRHGTPLTSTGMYVELPTQPGTYGRVGGGRSIRRTFTAGTLSADLVDPTNNLYTNLTRNVWRFNDPGRGQIDYYREGGGTPAALEGKIAQERDTHGNVRTYDYFLFGPENGPKEARLIQIRCYAAGSTASGRPLAAVNLVWRTAADEVGVDVNNARSHNGRLIDLAVVRYDQDDWTIPVQSVRYHYFCPPAWVYAAHLQNPTGVPSHSDSGSTGDLTGVIAEDYGVRPGTSSIQLVRARAWHYRYHRGITTSVNGEQVWGDLHQLKAVVRPEQLNASQ